MSENKETDTTTALDGMTLRQVLNAIDGVLMKGDERADDLWSVMSALRGPDSTDRILKEQTTTHVRSAAFPRTRECVNSGDCWIGASFTRDTLMTIPVINLYTSGHFLSHIGRAFKSLGIGAKPV